MNAILKAKRLARLLRDADAQTWLELEARGYPKEFHLQQLGTCQKYAATGGRVVGEKYWLARLPQLEAELEADRRLVDSARLPTQIPNVSSANPHEIVSLTLERTVEKVVKATQDTLLQTRTRLGQTAQLFNGLKSALHSYAADTAVALEFGEVAQSIFEQARERVDSFVREVAPKGAEQLVAALERFQEGDAESLSHALTSCRRLLVTVADALFPPREHYRDSKGRERKVGLEEYKNRLLAFIEQANLGISSSVILEKELEHLAGRLDAVYDKACKGVHADVKADEVRIVIVATYMFLGELVNAVQRRRETTAIPAPPSPESSRAASENTALGADRETDSE